MDAYARALESAVKPGDVVLDIGTGTGIAAVLACRLGAKRVYAVEPSDAIFVAQEIATANGVADRIEFIQGLSTEITLPQQADVIVSDLRGVLPVFEHHLVAIADARARHLAPGGVLIPQSDSLWVSVAAAPDLFASIASDWGRRTYDLDLSAANRLAVNCICKVRGSELNLLAPPALAGHIDYRSADPSRFAATASLAVTRAATAHGLCMWFDSILTDGVELSNAPDRPPLVYGQAFFPWPEPIVLATGDRVSVSLAADLVAENYVWQWRTQVFEASGRLKADMRQSELQGELMSPATLRMRAASHVAQLKDDGRIDALILQLMDEAMPLGDIAREIAKLYPGRFARWQDALARVGDLSVRYSR